MLDRAIKIKDQIISWRRDFHMHPELGFEETRTAGIVAEALKEMGIGEIGRASCRERV